MTILAFRIRKLSDLEGFDVIVMDSSGASVDPRKNGFSDYAFVRKATGLIQSVSQAFLQWLRAWGEVGGIAPSQCSKAFLPQPISI